MLSQKQCRYPLANFSPQSISLLMFPRSQLDPWAITLTDLISKLPMYPQRVWYPELLPALVALLLLHLFYHYILFGSQLLLARRSEELNFGCQLKLLYIRLASVISQQTHSTPIRLYIDIFTKFIDLCNNVITGFSLCKNRVKKKSVFFTRPSRFIVAFNVVSKSQWLWYRASSIVGRYI